MRPSSISIHAPPRGATDFGCIAKQHIVISIHAPPRGATRCWEKEPTREEFQFTPLREGRPMPPDGRSRRQTFQFTPLREGRPQGRCASCAGGYFNSRPSARGDPAVHSDFGRVREFQFTPLREGRPDSHGGIGRGAVFQFTPLREGRQQKICNFCKSFVQPLQISMA